MSRLPHGGVARWRLGRRTSETDALIADAHRHIAEGRRDHARRLVKEALLTEMSLVEGLEVGRLLDALDETQAAVDLFGTLLRTAADAIDAATVRARLLMVLGRYDEAIEPLRLLVEHRPEDAEARLHLAQCLSRSGQLGAAADVARRVQRYAPPWPDLHLELGRLLLRLGERDAAREALRAAVDVDPTDRRAALAVAGLWQRAGAADEALPIYEAALARDPDDLDALTEAGAAFARAGRVDAARRCLDQLVRRHPQREDARRRLAAAIAEAGGGEGEATGEGTGEHTAPAGFDAVVPAPGDGRTLGDVTTGEVEAALGTLDLDLDLDDFGSVPDLDEIDSVSPRLDGPRASGAFTVPAPLGADDEPEPARARRFEEPPSLQADIAAESAERERDAEDAPLRGRFGPAEGSAGHFTARSEEPPAARAEAPRPPDPAAGSTERVWPAGGRPRPRARADSGRAASALLAPPSPRHRRPTGPMIVVDAATLPPLMAFGSLSGDASVDLAPLPPDAAPPWTAGGERRRGERRAGGERRRADGGEPGASSSGGSSGDRRGSSGDRRAAGDRREDPHRFRLQNAPLPGVQTSGEHRFGPIHSAADPRRADVQTSGEHRFGPIHPADPRRADVQTSGEHRFGPIHSADPRRADVHTSGEHRFGPIHPVDPRRADGHTSGEHRFPALGAADPRRADGHTTGEHRFPALGAADPRRADGHTTGEHRLPPPDRRRETGSLPAGRVPEPPRAEGTGPLPRLPRGRRYAEMAIGRGLTSPGMPLPDGGRRDGDERARDVHLTPPPPGWDAAPRHDPVLTTSDALQRWRPPGGNPLQLRVDAPRAAATRGALLAGDPFVFWIPRLLRFMATARLTGTLALSAPGGQGEVQFTLGRLTGATATGRPSLAAMLTRPDRLSPEQRHRLGEIKGTEDGETLLERLVERGLFEAPNVETLVIDQVFATVGDLVGWHDGWFSVETRGDPGAGRGGGARLPLAALLGGVEDDREAALARRAPRSEAPRDPRLDARARAARQRVDETPDDVHARLTLAEACGRAGEHADAIEVLAAGLGRGADPRVADALGHAIDALAANGPRRSGERIALCGRLGRVNLVQLVELLAEEAVTGTLRLVAAEGLAEIHVVDGRLAGASNTNTARLGDLLRASSALAPEQIEALVAEQRGRRPHRPLGQLARESGRVDAELLTATLHKQVRLALLEGGRWRQPHFVFTLDERRRPARPEHDLDTDGILRDLHRMAGHGR